MWQIDSEKLARTRAAACSPIGVRYAFGEHGCIWSGFAVLMFLLAGGALAGAVSERATSWVAIAAIPALTGAGCLYASKIRFKAPTSPERTVRNFYEFIARGHYVAAWEMLVPAEHEPRTAFFADFGAFREYWKAARKEFALRSGKLFFHDVKVEATEDVAVCHLCLEAAAVTLVAPAIVALATIPLGSDRVYRIRKLVVKCGGEWRMWSPVFVGEDEEEDEDNHDIQSRG